MFFAIMENTLQANQTQQLLHAKKQCIPEKINFSILFKLEFEWKKAFVKTEILPKAEKLNFSMLF